jgi:hypothetical protein
MLSQPPIELQSMEVYGYQPEETHIYKDDLRFIDHG